MVALALLILRYIWPYLLGAAIIGGAYLWADEGWHNGVAKRAEKELANTVAQLKQSQMELATARQRATDLALAWDKKRQESEQAIAERDKEREQRQSDALAAAKKLDATIASIRIPAPAVGLLNGTIAPDSPVAESAASVNESPAAASQGADSTVGMLTEWGITVVGMYNACRDQVIGWIDFYSSLQAAQPKE